MGSLVSLKIKNLALISSLEIDFEKGLNIITGETGAGKSIIVNSLQLLIGHRGSSHLIREGENLCEMEAIFDNDEDELIIKRVLSRENKNKIKINNEYSTISNLKKLTENLIDFSSQNRFLFDENNQIKMYDAYCKLTDDVKQYQKLLVRFNELKKEINEKNELAENLEYKKEILRFQLKELEDLNLEEVDEILLKKEIDFLENEENIKNILNFSVEILDEILPKVSELKLKFSEISDYKKNFKELLELATNIEVELNELEHLCIREIGNFSENSEKRLNELILFEEKINELKRKYKKNSVKELIELKNRLKKELEELENFKISYERKEKELLKIEEELKILSEKIHNKRLEKKRFFEKAVEEILKNLKMEKVRFKLDIRKIEKLTQFGITKLKFLISPNLGEPEKPIESIASGGEKSRIILALKSFLSEYLNIPILIFDEIDAGTGGETAFFVGKLLKKLSKKHQVFAITHFPQVAAFADTHFKVYKVVEDGKTFTKIKKLNYEERVEELARMIAGTLTEKAKKTAEELINEAKKSECE